jgi:hypothetical protein
MSLQGGPQLRARLKAIKEVFKPVAREWAKETVKAGRPMVPGKTGRLRRSFKVKSVSGKRAVVGGHYTAYFVDKGPKPHIIKAKKAKGLVFQGRNGTVFARSVNHRGYRGRPFRQRMAEEGLRRTPAAEEVVKLWNQAA